MTLLDAYALIAFLVGGPGAAEVRGLLREGGVGIATANLAEGLDVARRLHGLPIERAMEVLEPLLGSTLAPLALDVTLARRAAEVRARYYHRTRRPISLADAILIASAGTADRIATPDPHVLAVAKEAGIGAVALPGTG